MEFASRENTITMQANQVEYQMGPGRRPRPRVDPYCELVQSSSLFETTAWLLVSYCCSKYMCPPPERETHIQDNPIHPSLDHRKHLPLGWSGQSKLPHR